MGPETSKQQYLPRRLIMGFPRLSMMDGSTLFSIFFLFLTLLFSPLPLVEQAVFHFLHSLRAPFLDIAHTIRHSTSHRYSAVSFTAYLPRV